MGNNIDNLENINLEILLGLLENIEVRNKIGEIIFGNENYVKKIGDLKKENEKLKLKNEELERDKDILSTIEDNKEELERVAVERDQLGSELERVVVERDQLGSELERVVVERDQLGSELEQVIVERDHLGSELERVAVERDHLGMELKRVTVERDHLVRDLEKVAVERDQLRRDLEEVTVERDQLGSELEKVIGHKEEEYKRLEDEYEKLKDKILDGLEVYNLYNSISGNIKNELKEIFKGESFEDFLFNGAQVRNIDILWEISKKGIMEKDKMAEKIVTIFYYFFDKINKTYVKPMYEYIEVKTGERANPTNQLFIGKASGEIRKILLKGYQDRNGKIIKKSIVVL